MNDVVIEDSFCAVGPDADGDGGTNAVLRHTTVRNVCYQDSAILLSSNTDHVSTVTIDDNLLGGGGYTLYCAGDARRSGVDHITVTNNRFSRLDFENGGGYGPVAHCDFADVFSGNLWDDTGETVTRER